jgi:hypothetical protein
VNLYLFKRFNISISQFFVSVVKSAGLIPKWAKFNIRNVHKLLSRLDCKDKRVESLHDKVKRAYCRILLLENGIKKGDYTPSENPMRERQVECVTMFFYYKCSK